MVLLTRPNLQILSKTQTGVFPISGKSFIDGNCHSSRTSLHIDMKLGPAIKLDKKNTATSKKIDDDVMSVNCDVIVFFLTYGQFAAIPKPDYERIIYKTYIFSSNNLFKQNYKFSKTALILLPWGELLF